MHTKVIHAEVVSAYSHCPRKAFLLHCTEDRGTPNDYACILEKRASANRTSYLATLQRTSTSTCSYNDQAISSGIEVLTEANLEAANVAAYLASYTFPGETTAVIFDAILNKTPVSPLRLRSEGRPPSMPLLSAKSLRIS